MSIFVMGKYSGERSVLDGAAVRHSYARKHGKYIGTRRINNVRYHYYVSLPKGYK